MAAAANDPGAASGVLAPRLVRLAHHDYPTDSYGKTSAFPLASPSSVVDQLHVAGAEAGRRVGRSRAGRGVVADQGEPDRLGAAACHDVAALGDVNGGEAGDLARTRAVCDRARSK